MKKKILWMFLSFLLVVSLVLASCAKAEVVEEEEEEEEEEVVVEEEEEEEEVVEVVVPPVDEPQYGGKLTIVHRTETTEGIPDPANPQYPCVYWMNHVLDRLFTGGLEKYGPRGTGEFSFQDQFWPPEKFMVGSLAESWEITADEVVLHIRQGVYWSGISINPVMESREYTASDFVFNFNRALEGQYGESVIAKGWIESVRAEDRYTAVVTTKFFNAMWYWDINGMMWGIFGQQIPPETVAADPSDWRNIVGTGPFVITKWVPGTYMVYEPNPLYWRKTTINGKEYKIPFVDELVYPIIADEATALAALRTATLDTYHYADWLNVENLTQTTPELLKSAGMDGGMWTLSLRVDKPPFDKVEVRRALFLGTEKQTITRTLTGKDFRYEWPMWPEDVGYIPFEELPAETRLLYDYNPELAMDMLAKAGYSDGFKANMIVSTRPLTADLAEWVVSVWKKNYNIDLSIEVIEMSIMGSIAAENADTWDIYLCWEGCAPTMSKIDIKYHSKYQLSSVSSNRSHLSDPYVDQLLDKGKITVDADERQAMYEELGLYLLNNAVAIPFGWPSKYNYWWPWVKNYYGESYYWIHDPPYDLMWIDQDLKAEMGY